jgi:hypothetical protein
MSDSENDDGYVEPEEYPLYVADPMQALEDRLLAERQELDRAIAAENLAMSQQYAQHILDKEKRHKELLDGLQAVTEKVNKLTEEVL